MSKLQFKYVRIQGKELVRNTMYAKGIFSMCMQMIRDEIKSAYPQVGEITITQLGVVIGAHCGPGLLTVFYLCGGRNPD